MPDGDYRVQPITFERGVNESVEASLLPAGAAVRIRNWASDPSGNLRARVPWKKASTTGAPATRKGRGAAAYTKTMKPTILQSNWADSTTSNSTASVSVSWNRNTVAGNLLVMRVMAGHTSDTTAITDITVPGNWATAVTKSSTAGTPGQFVGIYYVQNNAGAEPSVSVSVKGASGVSKRLFVEISEWTNMDNSAVYSSGSTANPEITSTNSGNSTAVTWADPTLNSATDYPDSRLDLAAAFISGSVNFTPGTSSNNYREQYDNNTGGVGTVGLFYRIATDKRLAFNQEASTGGYWISAAVCFKGSALATETPYIVAAHATDAESYALYYIDRNNLASGTWASADSILLSTPGATSAVPLAFAAGLDSLFYTTNYFDTIRRWNSISGDTSQKVVANSPAGRALAFHKNRLWSGGCNFAPTRLFYSEINDYTDWSGTAGINYIDISSDDGEPIEDLISFGSSLLIGKRNSLWLLSGSDEADFTLSRLTGGGCAPGRSMVATPYGAVVAGKTGVWLVGADGGVQLLSRGISKNYAMTGSYMSVAFVNDVVYVCDNGNGTVWTLNMNTGVWAEEVVDSATGVEKPAFVTHSNELLLFTPKQSTVGSLVSYRSQTDTRGKDFDSLSETFEAITPEVWPVGNTVKITPRHLYVRVRQRGGTADQTGLTITPYYEGWEGTAQTFGPEDAAGVYRYRFDLGERRGINYAQFKFSQTVPSGQASVVDVEEVEFGFNVEQIR